MLRAIYADVKTCIKTPVGLTDYLPCPLGVRQGCIISPIMFTLFLTDMQDFISLNSHGIDIETTRLFQLLFIDDLVIFCRNRDRTATNDKPPLGILRYMAFNDKSC